MSGIPFAKVQALGNTFVLIETGSVPQASEAEFAVEASRPSFGVGSDGLLVLGRLAEGLELRMYNPDGSPDFCGNGLRSAAWFAHSRGWIGSSSTILHGGVLVPVQVSQGVVKIEIPAPSFEPADVQLDSPEPWIEREVHGVVGTAVSTGSTHFVVFRERLPEDDEFFEVSPKIELSSVFLERTSVMWAVREADDAFRIRIWERGAGETQGCGTGSIAVAAVARMLLGAPAEINVHNPGGTLLYRDLGDRVEATSAASIVFLGQWSARVPAYSS
ncbi:MAG: diaminopimelate epimerase [Fimbriimonadaceae bacterium]